MTLAISVDAQAGATDPFDSGSGQALNRPTGDHEHEQEQEQEKKQKYTCSMHPEVVMDHPGNCPKCGMKLVPLKQNKRRISNSDKSRAGAQRPTSNSEHMMHHGDDMAMPHRDHGGHEMHMEMHSTVDLADPMNREGSGTSWLPDSSPMYGRMFMFEDNMLKLHGAIFPRYTNVHNRCVQQRIDA